MRNALTISLPKQMVRLVKDEIKTGKYASTSEFFRDLLREWEEERLIASVKRSEREFAQGKGKVLKSLKDLR